jgi:hypothetical protein
LKDDNIDKKGVDGSIDQRCAQKTCLGYVDPHQNPNSALRIQNT